MEDASLSPGDDAAPDALLRFLGIVQLLENCIVKKTYVVPDALVRPIVLTDDGEKWAEKLRNVRVKPNESKLAVALQFGWGDKIFISPETDVFDIQRELSNQIKSESIRFPLIFGREVHDFVATSFPERPRIGRVDTLAALNATPKGVFQVGDTLVSPFGCFNVRQARRLDATRDIPAYRCSDSTCSNIHSVELTTAESNIMKARERMSRFLDEEELIPSRRPEYIREQFAAFTGSFDYEIMDGLIDLVADSLTLDELRALVDRCLRSYLQAGGDRLEFQRTYQSLISDPSKFVADQDLAHLLGILLFFTDAEIVTSLEQLLRSGVLVVPPGSVREARIDRFVCSADMQLGHLGVRRKPTSGPVAAQRMANLIRRVVSSGRVTVAEIAHAIELPSGSSINELTAWTYANAGRSDVLAKLLPILSVATEISRELNLQDCLDGNRSEFSLRVSWRLGLAEVGVEDDSLAECRRAFESLREAQQRTNDEAEIRGIIANGFVALEDVLYQALKFSTWAFTVDHFVSEDGFAFDQTAHFNIDDFLDVTGASGSDRIWDGLEKPTLAELAGGFGRLAKRLQQLSPVDCQRERADLPILSRYADRPFSFPYRFPFLNLEESAKAAIADGLRSISSTARSESVIGVRNAGLHGNTVFPDKVTISECLSGVDVVLGKLDELGVFPRPIPRVRTTVDELGRATTSYSHPRGDIEIPVNPWKSAPRLPVNSPSLIFVRSAVLGEVGPLRFRVQEFRGDSEYWSGWPVKWSGAEAYTAAEVGRARQDPNVGRSA